MQENRSFDSYFGTYPGADGIPMLAGMPAVCVPDPSGSACSRSTTTSDRTSAARTGRRRAADIDGGKMDGFVKQRRSVRDRPADAQSARPGCAHAPHRT